MVENTACIQSCLALLDAKTIQQVLSFRPPKLRQPPHKMTTTLETNRVAEHLDQVPEINLDPASTKGGITISGEMVTKSTADLPEEQRDLVRWLYGYARTMGWDWAEAAQKTILSKNTLYKIWTGKYQDKEGDQVNLAGVCERIKRMKALEEDRDGVRPEGFVETMVHKRMAKVCEEARIMQIIAFIYGESQIGKTTCAQEYARLNNHGQTVFFRTPSRSSDFLPGLASACHKTKKVTPNKMFNAIKGYLDHTKLLIIDEVHLMFEIYTSRAILRTMGMLRELHDIKRCGLVLIGTNVFRDELAGDYAKTMAQLRKRGIYELQLPAVAPQADVDAIAATYKLKPATGEAADLVKLIVTKDGLGKYTKYLMKARQMAAKNKQPLSWDHVVKADTLIRKLSIFSET